MMSRRLLVTIEAGRTLCSSSIAHPKCLHLREEGRSCAVFGTLDVALDEAPLRSDACRKAELEAVAGQVNLYQRADDYLEAQLASRLAHDFIRADETPVEALGRRIGELTGEHARLANLLEHSLKQLAEHGESARELGKQLVTLGSGLARAGRKSLEDLEVRGGAR